MNDFLNIVVENDLLKTFANMFEVIICLDLFASVASILGHMGSGVSE